MENQNFPCDSHRFCRYYGCDKRLQTQENTKFEIFDFESSVSVIWLKKLAGSFQYANYIGILGCMAHVLAMYHCKARLIFTDLVALLSWVGLITLHSGGDGTYCKRLFGGNVEDCGVWRTFLSSSSIMLGFWVAILPRKRLRRSKSKIRGFVSLSVAGTPESQCTTLISPSFKSNNGRRRRHNKNNSTPGWDTPIETHPTDPVMTGTRAPADYFREDDRESYISARSGREGSVISVASTSVRHRGPSRSAVKRAQSPLRRSPRKHDTTLYEENEDFDDAASTRSTPTRTLGPLLDMMRLGSPAREPAPPRKGGPFQSLSSPAGSYSHLFQPSTSSSTIIQPARFQPPPSRHNTSASYYGGGRSEFSGGGGSTFSSLGTTKSAGQYAARFGGTAVEEEQHSMTSVTEEDLLSVSRRHVNASGICGYLREKWKQILVGAFFAASFVTNLVVLWYMKHA